MCIRDSAGGKTHRQVVDRGLKFVADVTRAAASGSRAGAHTVAEADIAAACGIATALAAGRTVHLHGAGPGAVAALEPERLAEGGAAVGVVDARSTQRAERG